MQELLKNKLAISVSVILVAAMFLYRAFSNGVPAESFSASEVGKDLLELSEELSRVTLSRDIFTNRGYENLTEFTSSPPTQLFGRPNPFDIIGRD